MIKVTQKDSVLAHQIMDLLRDHFHKGTDVAPEILQLAARHRIAAMERCAGVADGWMSDSMLAGDCATQDQQETGRKIAATIRKLAEGE